MTNRSIRIKVLKSTSKTVTVHLMSANRKMRIQKDDFLNHLDNGMYDVDNPKMLEDIKN
ncbi:MAG: hypothetical protein AAGG68_05310 [Bacteroidota bacterium]